MSRSPIRADASQKSPSTALPCQRDPERWFDRANRTDALANCLACPVRSWCAQSALAQEASWGMWAGIWIAGRLDDVAHYLRAIAATPDARPHRTQPAAATVPAPPPPQDATRRPIPGPTGPAPAAGPEPTAADRLSVRAALMTRSSGHCEIMAPGCRYTSDKIVSRVPGLAVGDADDASVVYVICNPCEATLSHLDRQIAHRLGYLVSQGRAAAARFYSRQWRWVQLEATGRLRDTEADADCA